MPPKCRFTREEIVDAALDIVRRDGIDHLTARALGTALGTSAKPIFGQFDNMKAVKSAVHSAAEALYCRYLNEGLKQEIPFLGFGIQYIRFAREEPELYKFLFLTVSDDVAAGAAAELRFSQKLIRESIGRIYSIEAPAADRFVRDMWLVAHSITTLIVTGCCPYSNEEIRKILTGFSISLCKALKEIPGFFDGSFDRDALFTDLIKRNKNP